jgi:hypothetical protein
VLFEELSSCRGVGALGEAGPCTFAKRDVASNAVCVEEVDGLEEVGFQIGSQLF